ncbi:sporulation protein YqfD [Alicyclobacillus contaminans]|uniref:sporulation protein YqfD n=1 Tax=Alicyclobacillus contaminans TaxID=392016 RepID=UPI0003FB79EF|nr:sporulation protein YqfD [Alicyclobacillus contaminans]GMA52156.1 sporulation protein YqfD [Alicyclobacillus contaminans]
MRRPHLEHLLLGSLLLEIRGKNSALWLKDLQHRGVPLFDVRLHGDSGTVTVGLRDFPEVYEVCRRHGVKLRFVAKAGFPFWRRKLWRRKVFLLGFVAFFAVLYGLSHVVWQVTVVGAEEDTQQMVLQTVREMGVHRGAWSNRLPANDEIQSRLLQKLPSLMWAGVQIDGSRVTIEVVPKVPDVAPPPSAPHDILAGKPGVIRKVYANRGTVLVQPGQVVHPGQVVISGNLGNGIKRVPADGQVFAEVWYNSRISVPLQVEQAALTGRRVERGYLTLGSFRIRLWGFEQPDFTPGFEREVETDWKLGGWRLPVQWTTRTLFEVSATPLQQSEQQAEAAALRLAAQDVQAQMHGDGVVLGQTVLHREVEHGKLYETIVTKTEEDIGVVSSLQQPANHAPGSAASPSS